MRPFTAFALASIILSGQSLVAQFTLPGPSFLLRANPIFDPSAPALLPAEAFQGGFIPSAPRTNVIESVQVYAHGDIIALSPDSGLTDHVAARTVTSTAGAYNDIPRYLQTLAGVQFDSDARNTYLVNGGNPTENLYVIDGVEIPNINHVSSSGSSAGLVSVIDTSSIASLDLHKQLYGSEFSGTLSSVLDLHTVTPESDGRHGNIELGYAGAGFLLEQPVGSHGFVTTQYRKSIVNYITNDIGIGGVPIYSSVLSTGLFALGPHDTLHTLILHSADQLSIAPNTGDWTNPGLANTAYTGNRTTFALTWHHSADNGSSDLQLSYLPVTTTTLQTDARNLADTAPIYSDHLSESPLTTRYDEFREYPRLRLQAGATFSLHSLDFHISQAQGFPTPYSVDPTPVNASNIAYTSTPLNDALYLEAAIRVIGQLELQSGIRFEQWGINNSSAVMPRLSAKLPLGTHALLFGGVGDYAQMPPLPDMLGIASNLALKPIHNLQTQLGATFTNDHGDRLAATLFGRDYTDYPVSTQFPTLSLADTIDPFGQPNLYMPLTSAGRGRVRGAELDLTTNPSRTLFVQLNLTSQSVQHTALDGVWRRANYDMPLSANILDGVHLPHHQVLTTRYSLHTGTPYTPFLLPQSIAQDREIFDLTQINTQRGGNYARLDARYEITVPAGHRHLQIFVGCENILNKSNFYQYVLLPTAMSYGPYPLTQMSRYFDGGTTWTF